MQRGFTLKDFMSQLVANCNDPGKGRNMPVHYSGRDKVGAVSGSYSYILPWAKSDIDKPSHSTQWRLRWDHRFPMQSVRPTL